MRKTLFSLVLVLVVQFSGNTAVLYPTIPAPLTTPSANENTQRESDYLNDQPATEDDVPAPSSSSSAIREDITQNKIIDETGKEFENYRYSPLLTPNDPNYNNWWVNKINLPAAWDTPHGPNQTILAIIDTGFALNHEEFTNRWYQNSGETGVVLNEAPSDLNCSDQSLPLTANCNNIDDDGDGINDNESNYATTIENPSRLNCTAQSKPLTKDCNLIDDDGNGLVDDWRGWDFINHDQSVQAGEMNPDGSGTHHGTYVAGVAAATGNNGRGIAGVDWQTKILPIQALDDDSFGHTLSVARSIRYAYQQGADVISLSLGSSYNDPYLRIAIAEAIDAGSIVVAASGNDGCDCMVYPANFPEVVAVGATTSADQPASFSNSGANLDVLAPGVSLYTTNWLKTNQTSAYASVSGTSLATPVVSGLLSRMKSYQPTASANQLIAALQENTNRLTLTQTQNRTNQLGFGRIIADRAMNRMAVSREFSQIREFSPVRYGSTYETRGANEHAYECSNETLHPTTPLFALTKNNSKLFTISHVERAALTAQGYSSSILTYTCLSLPSDQHETLRSININQEFFNSTDKQP